MIQIMGFGGVPSDTLRGCLCQKYQRAKLHQVHRYDRIAAGPD